MNLLRYAATPLLNGLQVRFRRFEAASLVFSWAYGLSLRNLVIHSG